MKTKLIAGIIAAAALSVATLASAACVDPEVHEEWHSENNLALLVQQVEAELQKPVFLFKIAAEELFGDPGGCYRFVTPEGNVITVNAFQDEDDECLSICFQSDWPLAAVVVKGGPGAHVYRYDGICSDDDLCAPRWKNSKETAISHVEFLYTQPDTIYCWETAWGAGPRYTLRGNWATYTPHVPGGSFDIFAGRTIPVGNATFSEEDGMVSINIVLTGGAIFAASMDAKGNPEANAAVQGYENKPSGNPAPGLFAKKGYFDEGSTSATILVERANFYGIHLNVGVPCLD